MRFATDTGGTFTDLIIEDDDGSISLYKAPTVPSDPPAGVLDALTVAADARGVSLRTLLTGADTFIHGTTHAINAIITGRTARTALIVTEGHGDILTFREGGRSNPFDNTVPYPQPYVPKSLTFEVTERILGSGEILRPIGDAQIRSIIQDMQSAEVEAIAVAFLWSTINPAHELRVGELIKKYLPETSYSLSHKVNATLREFRRASAAAIDASLKPLMTDYLSGLDDRLRESGFLGNLMVLTSAGGMVSASEVAAAPISVINSGPSMAPVAGRYYADLENVPQSVIVADTGGTTYDISLVRNGEIPMTRDLWIGQPYLGQLAGYPSVDVKSVGAGGGSIASVDQVGMLHVGPASAGADPGPVCYSRGGIQPTVTDACVVLGYIDPDFFLGGAMRLDAAAAKAAIEQNIGKALGKTAEEAAWSILEVATENMVQAIQEVTVNQGMDPAEATLIGGGGAAGLNSLFIARRLGSPLLLIPETGAAMSAAGAMISEVAREFAVSIHTSTAAPDRKGIARVLADLRRNCATFSHHVEAEGVISFVAEARYEGQAWEIDVPFPGCGLSKEEDIARFVETFHATHHQIFSVRDEDSAVELLGLRARVSCRTRPAKSFRLTANETSDEAKYSRPAYFTDLGWIDTPVRRLESIAPAEMMAGPALIESSFTTVVVDPHARYRRSQNGSLLIEARL